MGANPTIYCLEKVTDYAEFERLCHDLMVLEGYPNIEPLGGFKDKGRDAIHVNALNGKTTIFAYSVREDWRVKLAEDAAKVHKHNHVCNRLVFITTADVTASERDEAVTFIDRQYKWELDLFNIERLRILLETKHPLVRSNHPQIFHPSILAALEQINHPEQRDHILIHYANSDLALAEWLARKLTSEGYLVWCEHLRSLGGEHYPEDVDDAIQNRVSCLVSLYSHSSLADPDIVRQRAVALNISKVSRHFFVPLRIDSLPIDEMDQVTRQLKFIPFDKNWTEGLTLLLEKLGTSGCPKVLPNGKGSASKAFFESEILSKNREALVSNCLRILYLPNKIFRFTPEKPIPIEQLEELKLVWAFRDARDGSYLSFHRPPGPASQTFQITKSESWSWRKKNKIEGINATHLVSELIRKSINIKCFQKGLQYCQETRMVYFPFGLAQRDKIKYRWPNGRSASVNTVGERKYHAGKKERYRYYLSPDFYVSQNLPDGFVILLRVRVRITDTVGIPLPSRKSLSRRKDLCMDWWNGEWLSRMLAICQFLSEGDVISIGDEKTEQIVISSQPFIIDSTKGINEEALDPDFYKREDSLFLSDDEEKDEPEGDEILE
jgi:hypothetical protein